MMEIELNGVSHAVEQGLTLEQLVTSLSLAGKAIAVAVNRQVVPAQRWPQHRLESGDRVDVVRAIGGG